MPKLRHTEEEVRTILRESERVGSLQVICRRHGISATTFYRWRAKAARENPNHAERVRLLEIENRRLRQRMAELSLDYIALRTALVNEISQEC